MSSETASLARLSMSLPGELFRQLDMMVEERGLPSRSQLIAELIRHALAEHEAYTRPDEMLAGTITIVYRGDRGRVRHVLLLALPRSGAFAFGFRGTLFGYGGCACGCGAACDCGAGSA